MSFKSTVIRLKKVPLAAPTVDHFEFDSNYEIPAQLKPNQVVLKSLWISVDPYIRGQLYTTSPNTIIESPQIAQVIRSNSRNLSVGDVLSGNFQWSSYSVFDDNPKLYRKIIAGNQLTPSTLSDAQLDLSNHLGPMGLIGVTAYQGLFDIGALQKGEAVFVSGAAGAVGSIVGQIAKNVMGCRVVGVAGSDEKCAWLKQLGFDAALNYKKYDGDVSRFRRDLAKEFPDGMDVYFDNTGGFITESVWDLLNYKGRVVVCGQIANYNRLANMPKIRDFLFKLIYKHIRVEGFSIHSFKRYKQFYEDMNAWIKDGKIEYRKTVKYGLEQVPQAFLGLFSGENIGKMLVKISEPQIVSKL